MKEVVKKEITMTTKQLREHMADALAGLERGTAIRLTYRHRDVGILMPIAQSSGRPVRGSAAAVHDYLSRTSFTESAEVTEGPGEGAGETGDAGDAGLSFKQELRMMRYRSRDDDDLS